MQQPAKVVAVLAANPALTSILGAMLAASPALRVRQFESASALTTYMRLSTVDLLVADFDCEAAPAGSLARALRHDRTLARREFQIIALAADVTPDIKSVSIENGIDEVILKPMSPKYLQQRVEARLRHAGVSVSAGGYLGPDRRERLPAPVAVMAAYAGRGDNVVPLFKPR